MTLNESLLHLKLRHPNICINPGFLAQLYIFANKSSCFIQYYTLSTFQQTTDHPSINTESNDDEKIYCCHCSHLLASSSDLENLIENEEKIQEFIQENVDPFWANYYSVHRKTSNSITTLSSNNHIILPPYDWIHAQITHSSTTTSSSNTKKSQKQSHTNKRKRTEIFTSLKCPNCSSSIGSYQLKSSEGGGILFAGGYVVCDVFLLNPELIRKIKTMNNKDYDNKNQFVENNVEDRVELNDSNNTGISNDNNDNINLNGIGNEKNCEEENKETNKS